MAEQGTRAEITDRGPGVRLLVLLTGAAVVAAVRIAIGARAPTAVALPIAIGAILPVAAAVDAWVGPRHSWRYHLARLVLGWVIVAVAGVVAAR